MNACLCTRDSHFREVAVYPDADTVILWMVACDECADGKALIEKRREAAEKAGRKSGLTGTLGQFRANLDRECQAGSGVRWRVDPGDLDRVALSHGR